LGQQGLSLGPVTQTGFRVDVATAAVVNKLRTPGMGKLLRACEAAVWVVVAAQQDALNGRRCSGTGDQLLSTARKSSRSGSPGATSSAPRMRWVLRECEAQAAVKMHPRLWAARTMGPSVASTASSSCTIQSPRKRLHPVTLLHAGVAIQGFPPALPVFRTRILPTWQDENGGVHRPAFTGSGCGSPFPAQRPQMPAPLCWTGRTPRRVPHSWAPLPGEHCAE
jgi:hypothetical protein